MDARIRNIKAFDAFGQLACVLIPLGLSAVSDVDMWVAAILLGCWQLLSFVAHLVCHYPGTQARRRRAYGLSILGLAVTAGISMAVQWLIPLFMAALACAGVVLGINYLVINFTEWDRFRQTSGPALSRSKYAKP